MKFLGILAGIVAVCLAKSALTKLNQVKQLSGNHWNYHNQGKWPGLCKTGQSQSPIALNQILANKSSIPTLIFENGKIENFKITNNGHTVVINLDTSNNLNPKISGGSLNGKKALISLHFHWPSEHVINGKRYPLESHWVYISEQYKSLDAALAVPFAVTVVAILYEKSNTIRHKNFQIINEGVREVSKKPGESFPASGPINVYDFLPKDPGTFFRYNGSLTTPNCNENINWLVFKNPSRVNTEELSTLTNIHTEDGELLKSNNRMLQNRNQRKIFFRQSST